jgi:hypothetical protein
MHYRWNDRLIESFYELRTSRADNDPMMHDNVESWDENSNKNDWYDSGMIRSQRTCVTTEATPIHRSFPRILSIGRRTGLKDLDIIDSPLNNNIGKC